MTVSRPGLQTGRAASAALVSRCEEGRVALSRASLSGLLSPHGPAGRIVDLVVDGAVTLLVDDRIELEYREVLARPRFGFAAVDVEAVLSLIDLAGERVRAVPLSLPLDDPDDLPFLEVAHWGGAQALVTGNPRHYRGAAALGVRVVSSATFLRQQS